MADFLPSTFLSSALRRVTAIVVMAAGTLTASAGTREIYSETADAKADVRQALASAEREHKRVILDFGGNWCGDCQVLDLYFHDPGNAALLQQNFVLVHINIGRVDRNQDIAAKYNVPLGRGVPALAVLDSNGKLLYSQRNGEFGPMRRMEVSAVSNFLTTWKPAMNRAKVGK